MENKLSTAEEIILNKYHIQDVQEVALTGSTVANMMIAFAKLHITRALEEASKNAHIINNYLQGGCMSPDDYEIDKESILNSYPLDNIK
jgi:hypothetical protein